jgi:hypothetical protein
MKRIIITLLVLLLFTSQVQATGVIWSNMQILNQTTCTNAIKRGTCCVNATGGYCCGNDTSCVTATGEQGATGPKGDTGATGAQGATGATGAAGSKGDKGDTGSAGTNGTDGISHSLKAVWDAGTNYNRYEDTHYGTAGSGCTVECINASGCSTSHVPSCSADDGYWYRFGFDGIQGVKGDTGNTGAAGTNGTNGTNGVGVPTGGTTGQMLVKNSGTNYDTGWTTPSSSGNAMCAYTPSMGSCGTSPSLTAHSTDCGFKITAGSGTLTSCAATFGGTYSYAPDCIVQAKDGTVLTDVTTTNTGVSWQCASCTSKVFSVICSPLESGGYNANIYDLPLDDNAGNTTVTNAGTGGTVVASTNTSGLHSATYYEGTGSFLFPSASAFNMYTSDNWTHEKFEMKWYAKLQNTTAANNEMWTSVGASDLSIPSNSITVHRLTGGTQLKVAMKGNGGSSQTVTATNFTNDTSWHLYTLTVDASGATWTMTLKQDTTLLTWDAGVSVGTLAVFNGPIYWSSSSGSNQVPCAYLDHITVQNNE